MTLLISHLTFFFKKVICFNIITHEWSYKLLHSRQEEISQNGRELILVYLEMILLIGQSLEKSSLTYYMMSRKPKENTHDILLMDQKLNCQFLVVNLEFTRGFPKSTRRIKLESIRRKFDKTSVFIDNSLICLLRIQNI